MTLEQVRSLPLDGIEDALYKHFEDPELSDWCEIASEGLHAYNVLIGPAQHHGEVHALLSAVASAGWDRAIWAVAQMLELDRDALNDDVLDRADPTSGMRSVIGFEALKARVAAQAGEGQRWLGGTIFPAERA